MAAQSDDLDQLLDSALDDFQNLNFTSASQRSGDNGGKKAGSGSSVGGVGVVKGLGMGLPDLKSKKMGNQKVPKEAHHVSGSSVGGVGVVKGLGMGLPDLKSEKMGNQKVPKEAHHVSEALDKLRDQTRETVKGLESISAPKPEFGYDPLMEDWAKQFEELAGSQDMNSMVEAMMQQLLSKEVLQDPMMEIGKRYPKWLEDHKASLSEEDYDRYVHQYELIKDLNEVYESEPGNFNKIIELMQKMQECGQPPNDIVQELAPDFDISTLGQLSPEMLSNQQNCSIM